VINVVFTADYVSGATQWAGELPENLNELKAVTLPEFEALPFKPDWLKCLIVTAWASGWQRWPTHIYALPPATFAKSDSQGVDGKREGQPKKEPSDDAFLVEN
jgi:hypothetical protein